MNVFVLLQLFLSYFYWEPVKFMHSEILMAFWSEYYSTNRHDFMVSVMAFVCTEARETQKEVNFDVCRLVFVVVVFGMLAYW